MSFDLEQFQSDHLAWATHNFGERRNPVRAVFGMAEEVGELAYAIAHAESTRSSGRTIREVTLLEIVSLLGRLCHADLKDAQGIRAKRPAMRVAILKQLEVLFGIYSGSLQGDETIPETSDDEINWAYAELSEDCRSIPDDIARELAADAIGDASIFGTDVASGLGLSFVGCIEKAWNEVRERDWVANPRNGITA